MSANTPGGEDNNPVLAAMKAAKERALANRKSENGPSLKPGNGNGNGTKNLDSSKLVHNFQQKVQDNSTPPAISSSRAAFLEKLDNIKKPSSSTPEMPGTTPASFIQTAPTSAPQPPALSFQQTYTAPSAPSFLEVDDLDAILDAALDESDVDFKAPPYKTNTPIPPSIPQIPERTPISETLVQRPRTASTPKIIEQAMVQPSPAVQISRATIVEETMELRTPQNILELTLPNHLSKLALMEDGIAIVIKEAPLLQKAGMLLEKLCDRLLRNTREETLAAIEDQKDIHDLLQKCIRNAESIAKHFQLSGRSVQVLKLLHPWAESRQEKSASQQPQDSDTSEPKVDEAAAKAIDTIAGHIEDVIDKANYPMQPSTASAIFKALPPQEHKEAFLQRYLDPENQKVLGRIFQALDIFYAIAQTDKAKLQEWREYMYALNTESLKFFQNIRKIDLAAFQQLARTSTSAGKEQHNSIIRFIEIEMSLRAPGKDAGYALYYFMPQSLKEKQNALLMICEQTIRTLSQQGLLKDGKPVMQARTTPAKEEQKGSVVPFKAGITSYADLQVQLATDTIEASLVRAVPQASYQASEKAVFFDFEDKTRPEHRKPLSQIKTPVISDNLLQNILADKVTEPGSLLAYQAQNLEAEGNLTKSLKERKEAREKKNQEANSPDIRDRMTDAQRHNVSNFNKSEADQLRLSHKAVFDLYSEEENALFQKFAPMGQLYFYVNAKGEELTDGPIMAHNDMRYGLSLFYDKDGTKEYLTPLAKDISGPTVSLIKVPETIDPKTMNPEKQAWVEHMKSHYPHVREFLEMTVKVLSASHEPRFEKLQIIPALPAGTEINIYSDVQNVSTKLEAPLQRFELLRAQNAGHVQMPISFITPHKGRNNNLWYLLEGKYNEKNEENPNHYDLLRKNILIEVKDLAGVQHRLQEMLKGVHSGDFDILANKLRLKPALAADFTELATMFNTEWVLTKAHEVALDKENTFVARVTALEKRGNTGSGFVHFFEYDYQQKKWFYLNKSNAVRTEVPEEVSMTLHLIPQTTTPMQPELQEMFHTRKADLDEIRTRKADPKTGLISIEFVQKNILNETPPEWTSAIAFAQKLEDLASAMKTHPEYADDSYFIDLIPSARLLELLEDTLPVEGEESSYYNEKTEKIAKEALQKKYVNYLYEQIERNLKDRKRFELASAWQSAVKKAAQEHNKTLHTLIHFLTEIETVKAEPFTYPKPGVVLSGHELLQKEIVDLYNEKKIINEQHEIKTIWQEHWKRLLRAASAILPHDSYQDTAVQIDMPFSYENLTEGQKKVTRCKRIYTAPDGSTAEVLVDIYPAELQNGTYAKRKMKFYGMNSNGPRTGFIDEKGNFTDLKFPTMVGNKSIPEEVRLMKKRTWPFFSAHLHWTFDNFLGNGTDQKQKDNLFLNIEAIENLYKKYNTTK